MEHIKIEKSIPAPIKKEERQSAASAFRKNHPEFDYVTRKEGNGIRFWRIK